MEFTLLRGFSYSAETTNMEIRTQALKDISEAEGGHKQRGWTDRIYASAEPDEAACLYQIRSQWARHLEHS